MKALIIWDSYGKSAKIADVEKETDKKELESYYRPERLYKITNEILDCNSNELNYNLVLGKNHNYLSDSIGFTYHMESYVCPITEEQAEQLVTNYKVKKLKKEEEYNKLLSELENSRLEKLKRAKETNKKQEISRRIVPCNCKSIECNLDLIIEYILPSGEIIEERHHSY